MANKIDLHIARKVRKMRIEKGLSTIELANILGFKSHVSITNMEVGSQGFTSKTIYLLCCVFGCEISELFPSVKDATLVKIKKKVTVQPKVLTFKKLPKI